MVYLIEEERKGFPRSRAGGSVADVVILLNTSLHYFACTGLAYSVNVIAN